MATPAGSFRLLGALGALALLFALSVAPQSASARSPGAPTAPDRPPTASTTSAKPVATCDVGAYLEDLYDIDPSASSFSARLWVWTHCPNKAADPLPKATFPNGTPTVIPPASRQIGDVHYDVLGLDGEFRNSFDMRNFPFTEQTLTVMVTAPWNSGRFRFVPDPNTADVNFNPEIRISGWKVSSVRMMTNLEQNRTNYGESDVPAHERKYSRANFQITLASSNSSLFWELAGPLFIIFFVSMLTFLLKASEENSFAARIGILGASLFVIMVNMTQTSSEIPTTTGVSLLGQLHLLTLGFVLFALGITVIGWRWATREGSETKVARLDHMGMLASVIAYTGVCLALVLTAANRS